MKINPCWRPFHRTERKAVALVSLVMTRPTPPMCVVASPGPPPPALAGRGAYAIRALPDLCGGIVSRRLETQVSLDHSPYSKPRHVRGFLLFPPPALCESRHGGLARRRVTVRSTNCSCSRHVTKTSASQSTPFARQVGASRAPHLRMRFLWTEYLSARHDFWPRPLYVGTHSTVTTCKANARKTPRFLRLHRTRRPVRRWSVGHDSPSRCALVVERNWSTSEAVN
jgi:hypothetical protein